MTVSARRLIRMVGRCAIWARVSKDEQESGNQLAQLRAEAARRGLEVTTEYVLDGLSAWTGAHREQLRQALDGARRRRVRGAVVLALDRLERGGIEPTLRVMRQFQAPGEDTSQAAPAGEPDDGVRLAGVDTATRRCTRRCGR